jgi:hypothetical protein
MGSATTSRAGQIEGFHNPKKYYYYHCLHIWPSTESFIHVSQRMEFGSQFSLIPSLQISLFLSLSVQASGLDKMSQAPEATPFSTRILSLFRLQQIHEWRFEHCSSLPSSPSVLDSVLRLPL